MCVGSERTDGAYLPGGTFSCAAIDSPSAAGREQHWSCRRGRPGAWGGALGTERCPELKQGGGEEYW